MQYDKETRTIKSIEYHAHHSEKQFYDEVIIQTNPRWKESELSGDEWRYSASVEFRYKGQIVHEMGFRNCETALQLAYAFLLQKSESGKTDFPDLRKDLCDQEGCSEIAITKAFLKSKRCVGGGNCGGKIEMFDKEYLQFCDRHKHRGDCDLQDNDDNYILVPIENI